MAGLALGIGVLAVAAFMFAERSWIHPWLEKSATLLGAYRSLAALVSFPLILVGGAVALFNLMKLLQKPDVELRFANAGHIGYAVANPSPVLARDVLINVWFLNLEKRADDGRFLQMGVPAKTVDFVIPGSGYAPSRIFNPPNVPLSHGDRVIGWASVLCAECPQVHKYWISFVVGQAGWYAEIPPESFSEFTSQMAAIMHEADPAKVVQMVDGFPTESRALFR